MFHARIIERTRTAMDNSLGPLIVGILCFLAVVVAVIVAFFKWLDRRSGQKRRIMVHAEASAVQEDYAKAVTKATLAFSERGRDANFAGIVICQKCGCANPRSSGTCDSCGTPINQQ